MSRLSAGHPSGGPIGAETAPPSRNWRKALLSVHIATAVGVLGTDAVLLALGIAGMRGSSPETVYPAASLVGTWLVAPLALTALATGALLGVSTKWGLVRYWWVAIKLGITFVLNVILFLALVPLLSNLADKATAGDALTTADRMPALVAPIAAVTLLSLNVVLAVFKPRWRIGSATG
ncbi:hypothetical protein ACNAW0_14655 [Micromonospora sp. SL1-18]|uniref:hypothetical protein n=1 Tax=Micromonospora sp. SL1-18 TaxID=3399128 RepID=UPI003A4DA7C8